MFSRQVLSLVVVAFTLVDLSTQQTCLEVEPMGYVGRDGEGETSWCPSQLSACNTACGSTPATNTCNGPSGILTDGGNFCYDCVCSDGSIPELDTISSSLPALACGRALENCEYSYEQVAQLPPAGTCTECPYLTADTLPTPTTTQTTTTPSVIVPVSAITTTSAPVPATTTTTTSSTTSTSTVVSSTTSTASSSSSGAFSFPSSSSSGAFSFPASSSSGAFSFPSNASSTTLASTNTTAASLTSFSSPAVTSPSSTGSFSFSGATTVTPPVFSMLLLGVFCGLAGLRLA